MRLILRLRWMAVLVLVLLTTACVAPRAPYDYTAFRQSKPRSILVLPPVNNTPDVKAVYSVYSQVSYPLAESGYYVFPVALVDETFRQNGLANPPEMHAVPPAKLREIFGADAALYITVTRFGATYTVFNSVVIVTLHARLVDLKTGQQLWAASASASNDNGGNSGGGLVGLLVEAAVKQVMNNLIDSSYSVAGDASRRLLTSGGNYGILPGPRRPVLPEAQTAVK